MFKSKSVATDAQVPIELRVLDGQKIGEGMDGEEVDRHMLVSGLMEKSPSLNDRMVKAWLKHPYTVPQELRDQHQIVWLWGSRRMVGGDVVVDYLAWNPQMARLYASSFHMRRVFTEKSKILLR